jgi:ubiquitin-like-conjugating enzyme ATG3
MLNNLHAAFHAVRQSIMPVLRTSEFMENGTLTPDEFIIAGNQLVSSQRSWTWADGAETHRKSYLPVDKQYLILKCAICTGRAASMSAPIHEEIVEGGNGEEWVCSGKMDPDEAYEDLPDTGKYSDPGVRSNKIDPDESYEDLPDTDEYIDPAVAAMQNAETGTTARTSLSKPERRFYTVYILYDNYYHTPRVYLKGHVSSGVPLTPKQMLEDVVQDYAGKTATLETHPHDPAIGVCISIHPCRHAATMKRLLENSCTVSQIPTVKSYMFFFLKFIASMIPTIEYDYTYSVGIA